MKEEIKGKEERIALLKEIKKDGEERLEVCINTWLNLPFEFEVPACQKGEQFAYNRKDNVVAAHQSRATLLSFSVPPASRKSFRGVIHTYPRHSRVPEQICGIVQIAFEVHVFWKLAGRALTLVFRDAYNKWCTELCF